MHRSHCVLTFYWGAVRLMQVYPGFLIWRGNLSCNFRYEPVY